jgi:hypothetical protein
MQVRSASSDRGAVLRGRCRSSSRGLTCSSQCSAAMSVQFRPVGAMRHSVRAPIAICGQVQELLQPGR